MFQRSVIALSQACYRTCGYHIFLPISSKRPGIFFYRQIVSGALTTASLMPRVRLTSLRLSGGKFILQLET